MQELSAPAPSHFNCDDVTKMAVTEVPCLNSDKDFKVADSGFALIASYTRDVSLNWARILVSHVSTKVKGPSQNKSLFHSLSLTHEFLSLL